MKMSKSIPREVNSHAVLDPAVRVAFEDWAAKTCEREVYSHTSTTNVEWDAWQAATLHERNRAADVCRDEQRMCTEVGVACEVGSPAWDRCVAGAKAARNCALGVVSGEIIEAKWPQ
jgi:hypothetical protein